MNQKPKRSRLGLLAAGAIVGSVLSLGAISGTASAAKPVSEPTSGDVSTKPNDDTSTASAMSGIRW